jgi:agmatinase
VKGIFNNTYLGARERSGPDDLVLLGCPLDATSSFRGGTRFAPDSVRKASWTLETYSPYLKLDLEDVSFRDEGNLELRQGDLSHSLDLIESASAELARDGSRALILGGEHLITLPILKALKSVHADIQVVHFDAHCDLRDDYEGQKLSHATVMKRVKELNGIDIVSIGVRSGTRQEFAELATAGSPQELAAGLKRRSKPVYLSFDLDVFDPSLAPGVTTPEPGGLFFNEVMEYFRILRGMNIVGADIVELSPDYDTTFVSSITAAKVAREVLMLMDLSKKG